jgi:hypothetical protein
VKLYEKEDIFVIKPDSSSADSLDSFANTNTGFTTLEESPSVYLQTSEFHKKIDIAQANRLKYSQTSFIRVLFNTFFLLSR